MISCVLNYKLFSCNHYPLLSFENSTLYVIVFSDVIDIVPDNDTTATYNEGRHSVQPGTVDYRVPETTPVKPVEPPTTTTEEPVTANQCLLPLNPVKDSDLTNGWQFGKYIS